MNNTAPLTDEQPSPFHPGEREVQRNAGVRDEAEKRGQRMLSADLNDQQVRFFHDLPFLIASHVDDAGQPWAGLFTGQPGFMHIDPLKYHCSINWRKAANPTGLEVRPGNDIGLLGIDLATRRRNRLNGTVFAADASSWRILVEQGYGNCPKYITEREWPAQRFAQDYIPEDSKGLSAAAAALAASTDTFFIATASGSPQQDAGSRDSAWGADVSHRGGEPGFLQVNDRRLQFEDFPGNNMFNTLGNITSHPQCGILLLDFTSGELVQIAASGSIEQRQDRRVINLDIAATRHWRPTPIH